MIKKNILAIALMVLVFTVVSIQAGQEANKAITKRFAMLIGANNGGKERVQLRYAVSDAKTIGKVFEEMGGVVPDDHILLEDPDRKTFFLEMGRLKEKINNSKTEYRRVEVIFYYSGHSDEDHIFLGSEKVSYKDFREAIHSMNADVCIAILDSCASAAFTRIKGGKKRLPFLIDTAYNMKGYAFMTSSSSDEVSQESDRINGSFFTHYLISGLRGAADTTKDGRVTLNEAYHFAFNETLAQTEKTMSGPQHPYYDIQMSGTGDVVMTDIRQSSALLVIHRNISGKIFIHDEKDVLVVELTKPVGREIELGLEDGKYRIINIMEGNVYESNLILEEGDRIELSPDNIAKTDKIYTTPRGDAEFQSRREALLRGRVKSHFFGLIGTKSTSVYGEQAFLLGGSVGFTFNRSFSVGIAAYARAIAGMGALELDVDFDPGRPAYGGVFFEYSLAPHRKIHFKASVLFGSGNSWGKGFFIFEPEIGVVVNLSSFVRIVGGLSMPFLSKKNYGLENPILSIGFQFGR
jgi:hypothetical protein